MENREVCCVKATAFVEAYLSPVGAHEFDLGGSFLCRLPATNLGSTSACNRYHAALVAKSRYTHHRTTSRKSCREIARRSSCGILITVVTCAYGRNELSTEGLSLTTHARSIRVAQSCREQGGGIGKMLIFVIHLIFSACSATWILCHDASMVLEKGGRQRKNLVN